MSLLAPFLHSPQPWAIRKAHRPSALQLLWPTPKLPTQPPVGRSTWGLTVLGRSLGLSASVSTSVEMGLFFPACVPARVVRGQLGVTGEGLGGLGGPDKLGGDSLTSVFK